MCRVCCLWTTQFPSYFQVVGIQDVIEFVSSYYTADIGFSAQHMPQLFPSYSMVFFASVFYKLTHYLFNHTIFGSSGFITLIIRLLAYTKQLAKFPYMIFLGVLRMQVLYRLVPDFFLMGMLKRSSARVIISLYASARSCSFRNDSFNLAISAFISDSVCGTSWMSFS